MKEILHTHDPVFLSWAQAVLKDADIPCVLFDEHTGVLQGSISAIQKRLMVPDDDYDEANEMMKAYDQNNI